MTTARYCSLLLFALACGSSGSPGPGGTPNPMPPSPPAGADDPSFEVMLSRTWLMLGDGLTPKDGSLEIRVTVPANTEIVDLWIDGGSARRLAREGNGQFRATITDPAAGDHTLLFAADD